MEKQTTMFDTGLWRHELRQVADLRPNPRNPRTITEQSLKGLRESLKTNGYTHRIIITQDNMILSGHARWLVMKEDDPAATIECLVATRPLTEEEEKNAILGHNVLGGSWDIEAAQMNFSQADWEKFDLHFDLSDIPSIEAPDLKEEKIDNNRVTLQFTNAEMAIFQKATALAKEILTVDPNSKPIPGQIIAICKEFIELQEK